VTLPPLVRHYAERALPDGARAASSVRITQEGTMWMKPGARGRSFTATEHFEVERVAFSWRARFPVVGPLALEVVDGYDAGRGLLELRVLGMRVSRQAGQELGPGEAQRYLAELPWVPHAIARNSELEWGESGDREVEVACPVAGGRPAVTFEFDAAGDIVRVSAVRRRQVGKEWTETPWGGEYSDYAVIDGIRVPAAAEVYWDLGGKRFVYWRGRVLNVNA
jgi:hypothetical protein